MTSIKNLQDIARKAGVSTATVSRVINSPDKVSEKTRRKVEQIIREHGYIPNEFARSLRSNRKNMVAIVNPVPQESFLSFPYFSLFLRSVTQWFSRVGVYTLVVLEDPNQSPYTTYRKMMEQNVVDGFIVMGLKRDDPRIELLNSLKARFVAIGHTGEEGPYVYVDSDNVQGGYLATRHLLELGRKRILMVNGFENDCSSMFRLSGYQKALEQEGVRFDPQLVINCDLEEETVFEMFSNEDFSLEADAVFATSDVAAIGVIKALKRRHHSLPVVGFDDIPMASSFEPGVTTIRQPIEQIGRKAAEKIFALVEGKAAQSEMVQVELVARDSTLRCQIQSDQE